MMTSLETIGRRSILRSAVRGLGAAMLTAGTSGCAPGEPNAPMPPQDMSTSPSPQDTPVPGVGQRILVRGEETRDAGPVIEAWLRRTRLLQSPSRPGWPVEGLQL